MRYCFRHRFFDSLWFADPSQEASLDARRDAGADLRRRKVEKYDEV